MRPLPELIQPTVAGAQQVQFRWEGVPLTWGVQEFELACGMLVKDGLLEGLYRVERLQRQGEFQRSVRMIATERSRCLLVTVKSWS